MALSPRGFRLTRRRRADSAKAEPDAQIGQFTLLEPRIVFDAAATTTATTTQQAPEPKATTTDAGAGDSNTTDTTPVETSRQIADPTPNKAPATETKPATLLELIDADTQVVALGADPSPNHTLFLVDSRLATLDLLASAKAAGLDVQVIDANKDGMAQIRAAVQSRSGVESVQILAPQQDGYLRIGNTWLSASNLDAFAGELSHIGNDLSVHGTFVIYKASGETGADGSAAIDEAVRVDSAGLIQLGAPLANGSGFLATDTGALVDEATTARTASAMTAAEAMIADFLAKGGTPDELFRLFNGGQIEPTAEWKAAAQAFLDSYRNGSADVRVEYRSNDSLYGALAAFAGAGTDGRPVIYLNADYAKVATSEELKAALVEEYGHYIDWSINGTRDTAGDEGERFAVAVAGLQISAATDERIAAENDHLNLTFDGRTVEVEMASLMFAKVYTTATNYVMEANQPVMGTLLDTGLGATRYLFQSTNPLDTWFSGNNVQGKLYSIDASNNVVASYFGEVSRLVKTGNNVIGLQFYQYPNDVVGNGLTASKTVLIEVPGFGGANPINSLSGSYTQGQVVGTSSDPVSPAMNALLPGNAAPTPAIDIGDAYMPTCVNNVDTGEVMATGNVLANDTDPNVNYSIDTAPNPDKLIETPDPLTVTNVKSNSTTASAVITAGTTSLTGSTVQGLYGTLKIGADGSYVYDIDQTKAALIALPSGSTVQESFNYTASDGKGGTATSTLVIAIHGGNDDPVAADDYNFKATPATTSTSTALLTGNVKTNDTDVDGNLSYVTEGSAGTTLSATPVTITDTGVGTFSSVIEYTYSGVSSSGPSFSSVNVNDHVYKWDGTLLRYVDTGVLAATVSANSKDVTFKTSGGSATTLWLESTDYIYFSPTAGLTNVTTQGSGSAIATPNVALASSTVFYLTGTTLPAAGEIVTGDGVPGGTTISSISGRYATLSAAATIGSTVNGTTLNDNTDSLTYVTGAIYGQYGYLSLTRDGAYSYYLTSPVPNDKVTDEYFSYKVTDTSGCTDTAVLHIAIEGTPSQAPVAIADTNAVTERDGTGSATTVTGDVTSGTGASTDTSNDYSPNGTPTPFLVSEVWSDASQTAQTVSSSGGTTTVTGTYGTLTIDKDGAYTYTLNDANPTVDALSSGGTLQDVFHYQIKDASNRTDATTLTITINGTDDTPITTADTATAVEASGLNNAAAGFNPTGNVLLNDTNPEPSPQTLKAILTTSAAPIAAPYTTVSGAKVYTLAGSYGTLEMNENGAYTYTVDNSNAAVEALKSGSTPLQDTFNYYASDGRLVHSTLTITINGADDTNVGQPVAVNEGSPYVIFTVQSGSNQYVKLTLGSTASASDADATISNGSPYATDGTEDFGPTIEYWNGSAWTTYSASADVGGGVGYVQVPSGGTLLVRTAIHNDSLRENAAGETFTLTVDNKGGTSTEVLATIYDDGTGNVFTDGNTTGTPGVSGATDYPAQLDDDRALTVSSVTVNEASPYAVFTVTGAVDQYVKLGTTDGTAKDGVSDGPTPQDYSPSLQYFNGTSWVAYTANSYIQIPGGGTTLLVRAAIQNDSPAVYEGAEAFTLSATNTGGSNADGTGTIVDDGTGNVFTDGNTTGTPGVSGASDYPARLDDDRALSVSSVTVNEASPYAVFTVTGADGQKVQLNLQNDGSGTGHATTGTDTGTGLQYFDGSAWQTYTASSYVAIPSGGTTLLVRVAVTNDSPAVYEGAETFTLSATNTGGKAADGTGTIIDDGTGNVFTDGNTTGTPGVSGASGYPAQLDDDRALTVSSVTVNEASPYAVFTVTGADGQKVQLNLQNDGSGTGHAITGTDTGTGLQYFDGSAWQTYTASSYIAIPSGGTTLLVRVAVTNDSPAVYEGAETFTLSATNTGGSNADGTGTIVDDGTGTLYPDAPPGTNGLPATDGTSQLDDDRALTVSSVTVNEASPYAVFTVTGADGQKVQLNLQNDGSGTGHAITGTDTGTGLQYFDGSAWQTYTASSYVAIPSGGTTLLVRVAVTNDSPAVYEGAETFTLSATNTGGKAADGTGTIIDDGTGNVFTDGNTTGTPGVSGASGYPAQLDDDRALTVSSVTVNEASPYAVFTVTGADGQKVQLNLQNDGSGTGHAITGTDTGTGLQYFDGSAWQTYTASSYVAIPSGGTTLLVRVAIDNDTVTPVYEGAETFTLSATNTGGKAADGTGTIVDDGTGTLYPDAPPGTNGLPATDGTSQLDDDRALTVSSVTVNEASPYAVFTVTGADGQKVQLNLQNDGSGTGHAITGTDTGTGLQYFDGSAWQTYTASSYIAIPSGGTTLLVRVAVTNDSPAVYEGAETFTLSATNTGGSNADGTGTIVDDGTGTLYPDAPPGTNGLPATDGTSQLDDDRALTVSSVTVNEASPYAVFTVTGADGQKVQLNLQNDGSGTGHAITGTDTGTGLQYFDGSAWQTYTASSYVAIPSGGTTLLVRVAVTNDSPAVYEGAETFTLSATNTGGKAADGTGTIVDDGTGNVFTSGNTTGTPGVSGASGYPAQLDDDRALSVSSVTVNEASPYAVFTVTGASGQLLKLNTTDGVGTSGAAVSTSDYGTTLQYFDGSAWQTYTANTYLTLPTGSGTQSLLVRVAIDNDTVTPVYEGAETFTLSATNTGSKAADGTGTIVDDGTGNVFTSGNTTGTPGVSGASGYPAQLDDDRALTVSSVTVNEASPYAVFTVTGADGQKVQLNLQNDGSGTGHAITGTDTGTGLQYFDGSAWQTYTASSYVAIPSGGTTLLVRVAVTNDSPAVYEGAETFTLSATNTGGKAADGTGTIVDDGTGNVFTDGNTTGTPGVSGASGYPAQLDDDRALTVSSVTVNEASPYAVFTVTGADGQKVQLNLQNDGSGTGHAITGTDTGTGLQYFDGSAWQTYTASSYVAIPSGGTTLLVRVAVTNDSPAVYEGAETFTLSATNTGGKAADGTGTIVDDGTGNVFTSGNTTGTPGVSGASGYPAQLDDDRALSVSSVTVNEASPYAVFTVTGADGQKVQLNLQNDGSGTGHAITGTDTGTGLQYFDGSAWQTYTASSYVAIPSGGTTLLVRVAIDNDTVTPVYEGAETFTLSATNTGGKAADGTGTIVDDGTGNVFTSGNTTGTPGVSGASGYPAQLDDDRALSVSSVTVNEASPYAVFTVTGASGQLLKLNTTDGVGTSGAAVSTSDYGTTLQYFDGSAWQTYTANTYLTLPTGSGTQSLLVRVAIDNDTVTPVYEGAETFTLSATNTGSKAADGTGTIVDDGTGNVFTDGNTTGTPGVSGASGYPAQLDDDRALTVSSVTVNEASPYAVFTVTGADGQKVQLNLQNDGSGTGHAITGTDTGTGLQYFDGSAWQTYTASSYVAIPSGGTTLLVRVAVTNDSPAVYESAETFTLSATNTGGKAADGTGTIVDDGTGNVFTSGNTTGTPGVSGASGYPAQLDDDRALSVSSVTVNEASPYAVFTVTGADGQKVQLNLQNDGSGTGHATTGTDTGTGLQYFDGSAWQTYTASSYVAIPSGGTTLLVRVAIDNDTVTPVYEGAETFTLSATNTGGKAADGTGTIVDDGTGTLYPDAPPGTNGLPATDGTSQLDDDRALTVSSVTVNEASPYAVFTVTGADGQKVQLNLQNDGSGTGHAITGTDTGTGLQYFDGSAWQTYTASSYVAIPSGGTTLLVRVAVTNDSPAVYEGAETFTLSATNTGGSNADGTGTIVDDGTGNVFTDGNTTGTPGVSGGTDYPARLDDDRALTVSSVTVNEASPYAVFTVTGADGQKVQLNLQNDGSGTGHAITGTDTGTGLQYFDGSAWQTYTASSYVAIPSGGTTLLVRVAIDNDTVTPVYEGAETFTLSATNTGGKAADGTGTIVDDGTGNVFTSGNTTGTPGVSGASGYPAQLDDDRALTVSSVTVNEASPYAVFTVTGADGQKVQLNLQNDGSGTGHAITGTDTGTGLQYFDGSAWQTYTASSYVAIPSGGTTLLVRVAVTNDSPAVYEGAETFTLSATNTGGKAADGTGTIVDDGTGNVFTSGNTTGTPGVSGASGYPAQLDDDRALSVSSVTVNEASPYAVFTVTGADGQKVQLNLQNDGSGTGHATTGTDTGTGLQYFDGSAWQTYTASSYVAIPSGGTTLLVRVAVTNDSPAVYEGAETFTLSATNTGGKAADGTGTIVDDGTGNVFTSGNTTGTPGVSGASDYPAQLDDDRALSVSSVTVNEASPYAVFTVTGLSGQQVKLDLQDTGTGSGHATVGADTGTTLQYFDGSAWQTYTASSYVAIPSGGTTLLVRVAVINDSPPVYEGAETFTLTAVNGGGTSATGTGTIVDDGTGDIYPDNPTGTPDPTAPKDNDQLQEQEPTFVPPAQAVAQGVTIDGTYKTFPYATPYDWTIIPLGPPPALVTGTHIATQQGTNDGFSTTPGPVAPPSGFATPPAFGIEPPLATPSGLFWTQPQDWAPPIASSLVVYGTDRDMPGAALFVATEPGQASVRHAEETVLGMPRGIFGHTDQSARITVEATLADGAPLPEWLRVNVQNGRVTINPPDDFTGPVGIRLLARDSDGRQAETTFTIMVRPREETRAPAGVYGDAAGDPRLHLAAAAQDLLALFEQAGPATGFADPRSEDGFLPPGRASLSHMLALAAAERSHAATFGAD